jgi:hypothetical protein
LAHTTESYGKMRRQANCAAGFAMERANDRG